MPGRCSTGREFIAFWLSEGRVLAGMNVNVWDVTDPIKALITSRTVVDPERLADPGVALESLTSQVPAPGSRLTGRGPAAGVA